MFGSSFCGSSKVSPNCKIAITSMLCLSQRISIIEELVKPETVHNSEAGRPVPKKNSNGVVVIRRWYKPGEHGIGPKEAIPKVLKQTDLTLDQMDWIELNEAFAEQALAVIGDLGLDPSKVNPLGGAIALGHPLGATGAIRIATLVHGLRRRMQKYGMVTMCIGTGMGAAGIFEAL